MGSALSAAPTSDDGVMELPSRMVVLSAAADDLSRWCPLLQEEGLVHGQKVGAAKYEYHNKQYAIQRPIQLPSAQSRIPRSSHWRQSTQPSYCLFQSILTPLRQPCAQPKHGYYRRLLTAQGERLEARLGFEAGHGLDTGLDARRTLELDAGLGIGLSSGHAGEQSRRWIERWIERCIECWIGRWIGR